MMAKRMQPLPAVQAKHYARLFGLPPERIRRFDDLNETQREWVDYYFGLVNAGNFIYATKGDNDIVWKREKRNSFIERAI
jgi:hypothetical protein